VITLTYCAYSHCAHVLTVLSLCSQCDHFRCAHYADCALTVITLTYCAYSHCDHVLTLYCHTALTVITFAVLTTLTVLSL
jgi:hypothetical protein